MHIALNMKWRDTEASQPFISDETYSLIGKDFENFMQNDLNADSIKITSDKTKFNSKLQKLLNSGKITFALCLCLMASSWCFLPNIWLICLCPIVFSCSLLCWWSWNVHYLFNFDFFTRAPTILWNVYWSHR